MWIWLGHPATSTLSDPPALPWLANPGWDTFGETMKVDANYLLLHENALDLTHFPHVHPGFSPAPYLAVPPPLEIEVSETSVSYHRDFPPTKLVDWQARTTGLPQDRDYAQRESGEFVSPGLHVDRMHILACRDGGSYDKILTRAFTPVNARSTAVFWQVSRNYLTGQPEISEQLRAVYRATLLADKRLLEAIQAAPKRRRGRGVQRLRRRGGAAGPAHNRRHARRRTRLAARPRPGRPRPRGNEKTPAPSRATATVPRVRRSHAYPSWNCRRLAGPDAVPPAAPARDRIGGDRPEDAGGHRGDDQGRRAGTGLDGDRPTVGFLDVGQRQQLECDRCRPAPRGPSRHGCLT